MYLNALPLVFPAAGGLPSRWQLHEPAKLQFIPVRTARISARVC
jgi:hypothetical protein